MKSFLKWLYSLLLLLAFSVSADAKYLVKDESDITVQAVNEVTPVNRYRYVELTIMSKSEPLTIMDVVVNDGECLFVSNQILTVIYLLPNTGKRLYFVGANDKGCVIKKVKIMIKDKERNYTF